jgi:hypothetical protein
MRTIRNFAFLAFLVAVVFASPPQNISAGNYCAIFLSACTIPGGGGNWISGGGCYESCETWYAGDCCSEFCAGLDSSPIYDNCSSSMVTCNGMPNCMLCACEEV